MEKGSFQRESLDSYFADSRPEDFVEAKSPDSTAHRKHVELDVSQIPLPNEIPQSLDTSKLPHHIARSAAIQNLILQNEDLMARLGVHLRKNAELEEKISIYKEMIEQHQQKVDQYHDHLLVLQEKDRLSAQRNFEFDDKMNQLKDRIRFLETQYAELYTTSKNRTHLLNAQVEQFQKELYRHRKYRKAMSKVARQVRLEKSVSEDLLNKEKNLTADLQKKLGEAAERIQFINRSAQEESKGLQEELAEAQLKLKNMEYISQQLESLKDERLAWENEKVLLERRMSNEKETSNQQIRELQEALYSFRQDAKEKAIQVEALEREIETVNLQSRQSQETHQALTDQVESLQCLWRDNQDQIEKMRTQIESLQKLNQQLSQQMNSLRKENLDLRNKGQSETFKAEERIKELGQQVQLLGDQKWTEVKSADALRRIEDLMMEIQSGFTFAREVTPSQEMSSSGVIEE